MLECYPYPSYLATTATCPLRRLLLLSLESLLAVAPDHDDRQERADDGGEEDDQDHRDADGPDAGEEQGVQDVVLVDEGLCTCQRLAGEAKARKTACHATESGCAP